MLAFALYFCTVATVAIPSALGVAVLYWLLGLLGVGESSRVLFSLAYALATPVLPYSTMMYGHQPAAALLLLGFAMLYRARLNDAALRLAMFSSQGSRSDVR